MAIPEEIWAPGFSVSLSSPGSRQSPGTSCLCSPRPPILGLWCTEGLRWELVTSLDTPHAAVCNPDRGLRWRGFVSICHLVGLPFPQFLSIRGAPASGSQGPGRAGVGVSESLEQGRGGVGHVPGRPASQHRGSGKRGAGGGALGFLAGSEPTLLFPLAGAAWFAGAEGAPGPSRTSCKCFVRVCPFSALETPLPSLWPTRA